MSNAIGNFCFLPDEIRNYIFNFLTPEEKNIFSQTTKTNYCCDFLEPKVQRVIDAILTLIPKAEKAKISQDLETEKFQMMKNKVVSVEKTFGQFLEKIKTFDVEMKSKLLDAILNVLFNENQLAKALLVADVLVQRHWFPNDKKLLTHFRDSAYKKIVDVCVHKQHMDQSEKIAGKISNETIQSEAIKAIALELARKNLAKSQSLLLEIKDLDVKAKANAQIRGLFRRGNS